MPTISFSGIASGIDGEAITKALLDARRLSSAPLEKKVSKNEEETGALEEFNSKLLGVNDSLKEFLSLAGGTISKNAVSSNKDAVSAVAGSNTPASTTVVDVISLAKAATMSFEDRFSSSDTPIAPGLAEPVQMEFLVGTGEDQTRVSVEVTSETTLSSLVSSINEDSSEVLRASAVNLGTESSPQYALVLNGASTGEARGALSVSVPSSLSAQGVFAANTISQAQDAVLQIEGLGQVTRPSNQVNDLLPGISLELRQAGLGPVSITVNNDVDKTAQKLGEVIEAINNAIRYSKENSTIERVDDKDGVTNVYGTLAHSRVDERAIESIRKALSDATSTIEGSRVRKFSELGVTTNRDGTFDFDVDKFMEAVSKDPQAAESLISSFADRVGTANGIVAQYTKYQGAIDTAIDANNSENETINDRLARLEKNLAEQEEMYRKLFANLETTMSKLNSSSDALSGMIAGLRS
jgi:flagellar hook-associated protein 2